MIFSDLIQETYFSLSANKARSFLTILGIVIGIGSVIAMISVGQGAAKDIESNIQSLGSNLLVISPGNQKSFGSMTRSGAGSASTLVANDAEAIEQEVGYIENIASTVSSRLQVKTTKGTNTNTNVYGVDTVYLSIKSIQMQIGSFLNDAHVNNISKVAVLGPTARDDLFGEEADPTGQKIRINNLEFTVIGVTQSKGGTGFGNADDLIYVPITTAQRYLTGNESLSSINVQVVSEELMSDAQQQITNLLLLRHKISDSANADFTIVNQADVLDAISSVAMTMTLLLGSI
ncbi:MAG: hypothetical protein A2469_02010, partial [Candidatus Magasanikbacteria bacterium RIFOXYC2_FULL_40_16]